MRHARLVACLGLLLICLGCGRRDDPSPSVVTVPPKGSTDPPEMPWALEIAESFLGDVVAGNWSNAAVKVVKSRQNPGPGSLVSSKISDEMGGSYARGDESKTWTIESKLLAPAKDEASFRGFMEGTRGKASFSLLVRVDDDKKWRVGDFSVKITPAK